MGAAVSPTSLTAAQLLAISAKEPERLFPGDLAGLKAAYRALVKLWHPDQNKAASAEQVFEHVKKLRDTAEERIKSGTWNDPNTYVFKAKDGKTYRFRYDKRHDFALGEMFIGPSTVAFVLRKEHADLFKNGVAKIKALKYADDKMKKTLSVSMPGEIKTYETDNACVVLLKKPKGAVLLGDLLKHEGGKLDPKHAAWIMTRLHNIACYLEWSGQTHNAIDTQTLFVEPEMHVVSLLGGWWHAARLDENLTAVPAFAADFVPPESLKTREPSTKIDLEMIRAVGRELLGDRHGTRLAAAKAAPEPMLNWLRTPSTGDARKDLGLWENVLKDSFGARRFTEMKPRYSDIYQPGG